MVLIIILSQKSISLLQPQLPNYIFIEKSLHHQIHEIKMTLIHTEILSWNVNFHLDITGCHQDLTVARLKHQKTFFLCFNTPLTFVLRSSSEMPVLSLEHNFSF